MPSGVNDPVGGLDDLFGVLSATETGLCVEEAFEGVVDTFAFLGVLGASLSAFLSFL